MAYGAAWEQLYKGKVVRDANVLYVTTRQWNPGDEFILAGCRNLLLAAGVAARVESIYNKSPQVMSLLEKWNFWMRPWLKTRIQVLDFAIKLTAYDNSFKRNHDLNSFDLVVVAGSPGWFGGRHAVLYDKMHSFKGQIVFLGLGTPNRTVRLRKVERDVLAKSLVTVRNASLVGTLERYGVSAHYLACPALLAATRERERPSTIKSLGLGFSTYRSHRNHAMEHGRYELQLRLYETVLHKYNATIICHYVDEVDEAIRRFGRERVVFRYDAIDYISVYSKFDYVISGRVHGCGLAASLGIPNAILAHDRRSDTAKGFLSDFIKPDIDIARHLDGVADELGQRHDALVRHKNLVREKYLTMIGAVLNGDAGR
jgi:hypothetical protein